MFSICVLYCFVVSVQSSPIPSHRHSFSSAVIRDTITGPMTSIIIFGGQLYDGSYTNELIEFDLITKTWKLQILQLGDIPFPRLGMELSELPPQDNNISSKKFFLYGGLGSSDGVRESEHDHDLGDSYIFDYQTLTWSRTGNTYCQKYVGESCTDAALITDIFSEQSDLQLFSNLTADYSVSARPDTIESTLSHMLYTVLPRFNASIQQAIDSWQSDSNNAINSGTCEQICDDDSWIDPLVLTTPGRLQGYRSVVYGSKVYLFGGYSCSDFGSQFGGGDQCYSSTLWIYDMLQNEWNTTSPQYENSIDDFPRPIAYSSIILHETRQEIWCIGGAYTDVTKVQTFKNDVHVYSIRNQQWRTVQILGELPIESWKNAVTLIGNHIYFSGGCAGNQFLSQLYVLRINEKISADMCSVEGNGITQTIAGKQNWFTIQTRQSIQGPNNTIIFGEPLTWGTQLAAPNNHLTVTLASHHIISIESGLITELGNGLYNVSYSVSFGDKYSIFVELDGISVPSSPFTLHLLPDQPTSAIILSTNEQLTITAKQLQAAITIQLLDQYGNTVKQNYTHTSIQIALSILPVDSKYVSQPKDWLPIGNSSDTATAYARPSWPITITNHYNGSYTLTYIAPELAEYYLFLTMNDVEVKMTDHSQPFLVHALNRIELSHAIRIAFWVVCSLGIVIIVAAAIVVIVYRNEKIIRAGAPMFMLILCVGGLCCLISVFFLTFVTDITCAGYPLALSIGFILSLGSLEMKSYRVMTIFKMKKLKKQQKLTDGKMAIPIICALIIVIVYNISWIMISPLQPTFVSSSSHLVNKYWSCTGINSLPWSITLLSFCGLIMLFGIYLASQTRNVPEAFNESKLLAGCLYNIAFVCCIVVPLLFLLPHSDAVDATMVIQGVVIVYCSTFNVVAIVYPKVYYLSVGVSPSHFTSQIQGTNTINGGVVQSHIMQGIRHSQPAQTPQNAKQAISESLTPTTNALYKPRSRINSRHVSLELGQKLPFAPTQVTTPVHIQINSPSIRNPETTTEQQSKPNQQIEQQMLSPNKQTSSQKIEQS